MNPQHFLSCCSTEADESEVNNDQPENLRTIMSSLNNSIELSPMIYEYAKEFRRHAQKEWAEKRQIIKVARSFFHIQLEYLHALLDKYGDLNTQTYAWYVQHYRHNPRFVDYAVEISKIKHQILESEVDWYIENITKDLEIIKNNHNPSFFISVLEQDQREALHTRAVINHALKQLEVIAAKITKNNAKHYAEDTERYAWCLTGMVPLLSAEEQDPFQENGIHQRWQKARYKIHEKKHQ